MYLLIRESVSSYPSFRSQFWSFGPDLETCPIMTPDQPSQLEPSHTPKEKQPAQQPACTLPSSFIPCTPLPWPERKRKEKKEKEKRGNRLAAVISGRTIPDQETVKRIWVSTFPLPCRAPGAVIGSAAPAGGIRPRVHHLQGTGCGRWIASRRLSSQHP